MQPATIRSLYWLPGPLLAMALVAFAVVGRGGPGFFFLAIAGGALLMFGAPLAQFTLLRTKRFGGRYAAACGLALLIVVLVLAVPILAGAFSFF